MNASSPSTSGLANLNALTGLSFLADGRPNPFEFLGHSVVRLDDLVKRIGYFSGDADLVRWHADGKVALRGGCEDFKKIFGIDVAICG